MTDDFNSLPYTELESVSAYFNSVDIQNPYTFVICVKGGCNDDIYTLIECVYKTMI